MERRSTIEFPVLGLVFSSQTGGSAFLVPVSNNWMSYGCNEALAVPSKKLSNYSLPIPKDN